MPSCELATLLQMVCLWPNLAEATVREHPYPHWILEPALDPEHYAKLRAEWPPENVFLKGRRLAGATKLPIPAEHLVIDSRVSPRWRDFVLRHRDPEFVKHVLQHFRPWILRLHPKLEEEFGAMTQWRIGARYRDTFQNQDVLIHSQLAIFTPAQGLPQADRGPHVKLRNKLLTGYRFFPTEGESSQGGDWDFYSIPGNKPPRHGMNLTVDPAKIRKEDTIPYRANTFGIALNTPNGVQGFHARRAAASLLRIHAATAAAPFRTRRNSHREPPQPLAYLDSRRGDRSMMASNLLAGISPSDVIAAPFPHVVIHNPIPASESAALIDDWPSDAIIQAGVQAKSNQRFSLPAAKALTGDKISPQWRAFTTEQTGPAFGRHLLRIFDASIPSCLPEFATLLGGRLDQCRFGVRGFETGSEDLVLDAQLSINTPAFRQANPARAAHVDLPQKLFIGLYYLKPPADTGSQGGDLILCRPKSGQPLQMYQREVDAGSLEEFQRIRYGRSVLVLFLNGPRSVHAVSPRQPTPHTRRFLNLIGQAPRPVFDVTQYQMPRWLYLARLFRDRSIDPSEFGFGEQRL